MTSAFILFVKPLVYLQRQGASQDFKHRWLGACSRQPKEKNFKMKLTRLTSGNKIYSINTDRILFIEQGDDELLIAFGNETLIFKDEEAKEVLKQLWPQKKPSLEK